jgi:glyoxylase-like metal-dependent hydrolase (beta-lactamase superfamily II)
LLVALIMAGTLAVAAGVQDQSSPSSKVELQKLKENLYLLTGGGANSLALVTDLGIVLVDTKLAGSGQAMLDKLKTVTPKPVTTLINTHSHPDATGGNAFFPTSVEIIAHENTRLNMDKLEAFKGTNVNFLPKLMFKEKMSIGGGKDRVDLYYFGAGHTSGDAWVVFPAARVMHAGDMIVPKQMPIVDFDNGGSGLDYPDALAKAGRLQNIDIIVPSHGPVVAMKDVEEYVHFTRDFKNDVVSGFNHGLSIAEAAESWKLPEKYRGFAAPADRVASNVRAIFSELTRVSP